MNNLRLNAALLRKRVPNLTSAARSVGLRPATVSNLCTGKIPVERAEVRTIVALASLAKCTLDELILREDSVEMIETKIKVLDLFAPIAKGGTVGLVARPGMGQLALLSEIFMRLRKEGYLTILLKPDWEYPELKSLLDYVDHATRSIKETFEIIMKTKANKEILFAADREHVLTGKIFDLQEQLNENRVHPITTFLVDLKGEAVDVDLPYGPLETLWHFDADLAARHKFPAVHPIYSTSLALEGIHLEDHHMSLQQHAKKLLRRYRELRSLVHVKGMDSIPQSELQTFKRGERLEAYLTQPFYIAETYSSMRGEAVNLQDTLKDVHFILNGGADAIQVESLNYIGRMS